MFVYMFTPAVHLSAKWLLWFLFLEGKDIRHCGFNFFFVKYLVKIRIQISSKFNLPPSEIVCTFQSTLIYSTLYRTLYITLYRTLYTLTNNNGF